MDERPVGPGAAPIEDVLAHRRAELISIADSILRDRHEAEDVVQDTIAATLKRLPAIAPEKLGHYLSRAVRQNALKRKSRRREQAVLDRGAAAKGVGDGTPLDRLDPFDLEEAIASLPLKQQSVVRMKYYLGMSFRQIGLSLSISTHTAASRCRYALAKLRHLLID